MYDWIFSMQAGFAVNAGRPLFDNNVELPPCPKEVVKGVYAFLEKRDPGWRDE